MAKAEKIYTKEQLKTAITDAKTIGFNRATLESRLLISKCVIATLSAIGIGTALGYSLLAKDSETKSIIPYIPLGIAGLSALGFYFFDYRRTKRERDDFVEKHYPEESMENVLKELEKKRIKIKEEIERLQPKILEWKREAREKGDSSALKELDELERNMSKYMNSSALEQLEKYIH